MNLKFQISKLNLKKVWNAVMILLFLLQFPIIPGILNSRRLAFFFSFFYLLLHKEEVSNIIYGMKNSLFICIFGGIICTAICIVNSMTIPVIDGNLYYQWYFYVSDFAYLIFFPIYLALVFNKTSDFIDIYINFMLFQSAVVLVELFSYPLRMFIYTHFYGGDNSFLPMIENGSRVVGFFMAGSGGSLCFCAAALFLIHQYINNEIYLKEFFCKYIVIVFGTMFMGRLGLYLEIILLIYVAMRNRRNFIYSIMCMIVVLGGFTLITGTLGGGLADYYNRWVGQALDSSTRLATIDTIMNMSVPDFSEEMILGTNISLGRTPMGDLMESDSGYAKMYTAIGIVGAIVFYTSFLILLLGLIQKTKIKNRFFYYLCLCILFIVEWKEPFFIKATLAWQVIAMLMLSVKETRLG